MSVPHNYMPPPAGMTQAQTNALIAAGVGGEQFDDFLDPVPAQAGLFATAALGLTIATFFRFRVARPFTATRVRYCVGGVQNGNVDLGVFRYTSTLTLLGSTGATPQGAINTVQTVNLVAPVSLVPFTDYAAAISTDSATATSMRYTAPAVMLAVDNLGFTKTPLFPLASTSLSGLGTTASMWWMRLLP